MTHGHSLWFWLVWAVVIWYSTITVYVAVKGAFDIRQMLRDLKRDQARDDDQRPG
jgi:heme exporter protein D